MTRVSPHLLSRISCLALLTFGSDQALCGAILGTMGCGTASLTPTHLMDAWSAPLPYLMSPDSTECRQVGTVGFPPSWALDLNSSLKSFFSTYWLWAMSYVLCCSLFTWTDTLLVAFCIGLTLKTSFAFFRNVLWTTLKNLFGQPNRKAVCQAVTCINISFLF